MAMVEGTGPGLTKSPGRSGCDGCRCRRCCSRAASNRPKTGAAAGVVSAVSPVRRNIRRQLDRPGHRLGRHRGLLPHQLAAGLLRQRHRGRILPPRPGLGRRTSAQARAAYGARTQPCPLMPNGRVASHRAAPHPGTGGGGRGVATTRSVKWGQQLTNSGRWLRSCARGEVNSARAVAAAGRKTAARWQFWNASRTP
jgi:hypothetical protein